MLPNNLPRIQLTDVVSQNIAHTSEVAIQWDAAPVYQNLITYNGSTTLTIQIPGLYVMTITHFLPNQASAGLTYGLILHVNGENYTGQGETINQIHAGASATRANGTIVREFAIGDTLAVTAYQRQATAQTDTIGGESNSRWTVYMVDK